MSSLLEVVFYSLIGGVFSLIGGLVLLSKKSTALYLAKYATPFAAGALLAAAFFDLLKEAGHQGSYETALKYTLVGILIFFLLEKFLNWFHHHHEHEESAADPSSLLIIIGDTLHNFIDGIAIAAGFLVDTQTGIIVTIAVAAHEIPQEIGDFGLLLKKGMSRAKVIAVNVGSALATTVAAVIFFQLGKTTEIPLDVVLGLVAGFFVYIATSDIIPSIHKEEAKTLAGWQTVMLLSGAIIVSALTSSLHSYIDQGHDHAHTEEDELHVHDEHEHEESDAHEHEYSTDEHSEEHEEHHDE